MALFDRLLGLKNAPKATGRINDDTQYVDEEAEAGKAEAAKLEAHLAEDPASKAAMALADFDLSVGARSLIDRALDGLSKQTGANLEDKDAAADAKLRAQLVEASGNDLGVLLEALSAEGTPTEVAGAVYSLLYATLKGATFYANLDYRQATEMDFASGEATVEAWFTRYVGDRYVTEALGHVVDGDVELPPDGDSEREPPMGLMTRREQQLTYLEEVYAASDIEDAVIRSLEDVRLFFQLTAEANGWSPEQPMPYGNVRNVDGSYTPITDVQVAIDTAEINRKAAQVKRREKRQASTLAAAAAARKILAAKLANK